MTQTNRKMKIKALMMTATNTPGVIPETF